MQFLAARVLLSLFLVMFLVTNVHGQKEENPFGDERPEGLKQVQKVINATESKPSSKLNGNKKANVAKTKILSTDKQIRDALEKGTDLIFDEEPFGVICEQLSQDLKISIVIDTGLEESLDGDTIVTCNLASSKTGAALRVLLKPIDATWVIQNGVLRIISTSDEMSPKFLVRRIVDVRPLLEAEIKEMQSDEAISKKAKTSMRALASENLQQMIRETVLPGCWSAKGHCRTKIFNGQLILLASEEVNEEVGTLLEQLTQRLKK